eukprot:jgi/Psemu1/22753/gm1.22753_g
MNAFLTLANDYRTQVSASWTARQTLAKRGAQREGSGAQRLTTALSSSPTTQTRGKNEDDAEHRGERTELLLAPPHYGTALQNNPISLHGPRTHKPAPFRNTMRPTTKNLHPPHQRIFTITLPSQQHQNTHIPINDILPSHTAIHKAPPPGTCSPAVTFHTTTLAPPTGIRQTPPATTSYYCLSPQQTSTTRQRPVDPFPQKPNCQAATTLTPISVPEHTTPPSCAFLATNHNHTFGT